MYYLRVKSSKIPSDLYKSIGQRVDDYSIYFSFEYETKENAINDLCKYFLIFHKEYEKHIKEELNISGIDDINKDYQVITNTYYKYNYHLFKYDVKMKKNYLDNLCFI